MPSISLGTPSVPLPQVELSVIRLIPLDLPPVKFEGMNQVVFLAPIKRFEAISRPKE